MRASFKHGYIIAVTGVASELQTMAALQKVYMKWANPSKTVFMLNGLPYSSSFCLPLYTSVSIVALLLDMLPNYRPFPDTRTHAYSIAACHLRPFCLSLMRTLGWRNFSDLPMSLLVRVIHKWSHQLWNEIHLHCQILTAAWFSFPESRRLNSTRLIQIEVTIEEPAPCMCLAISFRRRTVAQTEGAHTAELWLFWSQREEFVQSTEVIVAALTKIPSINNKDAQSVRVWNLVAVTSKRFVMLLKFICNLVIATKQRVLSAFQFLKELACCAAGYSFLVWVPFPQ